jgi:hypothetical protein
MAGLTEEVRRAPTQSDVDLTADRIATSDKQAVLSHRISKVRAVYGPHTTRPSYSEKVE